MVVEIEYTGEWHIYGCIWYTPNDTEYTITIPLLTCYCNI